MSTTADMLKWQKALNQNLLLKPENIQKAFRKYKLNSGQEFTYGYGWHIKEITGQPTREHGGSILDLKQWVSIFPNRTFIFLD